MMYRMLALVLAMVVIVILGAGLGDYPAGISDLLALLSGQEGADAMAAIVVLDFRLPRLALAFATGIALALAGAIAQAVMHNPLAEPGILGINAGAALAAMMVIVLFGGVMIAYMPFAGFAGALVMTVLVLALATRGGISSTRLILIGIGLGALAGAGTTYIGVLGNVRDVQRALLWLNGSLYDASWGKVQVLVLWLLAPATICLVLSRELDLMHYGDTIARGLGQPVGRMRALLVILCAALSGSAVAAAGTIGFVGLVAPHIARRLVGGAHGRLLPMAGLVGALLVMLADLVGRLVIAPGEIPAGLMTAILGAPYFGYLLWRRRDAPFQ